MGYEVPFGRQPVEAVVAVPPSKSIMNRALVCAALADGQTTIEGVAPGDDTIAMIGCLGALGVRVAVTDDDTVEVTGIGGAIEAAPVTLHAGLAGTTARFVTAVAALGHQPYTVDGNGPLRRRPMGPLHEALVALGAEVEHHGAPGCLPVTITGPANAGLPLLLPGDVSSQYVSALMMIGPYLPDGLDLHVTTPLVSAPYVWITAAVMRSFGCASVGVHEERAVSVATGRYDAGVHYAVEPDASSASYPLALAAVRGGTVKVPGLGRQSIQGDVEFVQILEEMGCEVRRDDDGIRLSRDPERPLEGIDVDLRDMSDLVPTLAVVAATASSTTVISGVGFIRHKESDRVGDLATELAKTGARVYEQPDGIIIEPSLLHGAALNTHDDHRLAMAFGVLGAVVEGIDIDDADVVSKTWPDYWETLEWLVGAEARGR
ncbi:3-phosphoshikimate 1-carboxyvinyltransferase [soil metagenome]